MAGMGPSCCYVRTPMWIAHHFVFPKIYPPCVKPTNRPGLIFLLLSKEAARGILRFGGQIVRFLGGQKMVARYVVTTSFSFWNERFHDKGPLKKQARPVLIFNDSFHSTIFVIRCVFSCHQILFVQFLFTITLISKPRHLQPFANLLQDLCWNDL